MLRWLFYDGLPECIKDDIARVGKPAMLAELRTLSQTLDVRYWERKNEVSQHAKPTTSTNVSSNTIPSHPTSSFTHTHNSAHTSGSRPSKDHKRPEDRSTTKPDISSKLGENGKLAPEERKHRFDNHLCMFCGQSSD